MLHDPKQPCPIQAFRICDFFFNVFLLMKVGHTRVHSALVQLGHEQQRER